MENVKTIVYALALAMTIRFALVQPFRIPSGSMQPTLLVGDYIVVTKWSYGYSRFSVSPLHFGPAGRLFGTKPEAGDVVVFRPPNKTDADFVKRLIGIPGDRVQFKSGALYINEQAVERTYIGKTRLEGEGGYVEDLDTYVETLPNGATYNTFDRGMTSGDDTAVYQVPEGHYLMIGDDRDNSSDSRREVSGFGFVPFDHLVGKAQFVVLSFDQSTSLFKPWTLFTGFRTDRFVHGVD